MNKVITPLLLLLITFCSIVLAQTDSIVPLNDSTNLIALEQYGKRIAEIEQLRLADSIKKADLELQLSKLKTTDNLQKEALLKKLKAIDDMEMQRVANLKVGIDSLRKIVKGYPVVGFMNDTLFSIYTKYGALTPKERATNTSLKIEKLYYDDFLNLDSITVVQAEHTFDIVYNDMILMSISEKDAIWNNQSMSELAHTFKNQIKQSLIDAKEENSLKRILIRIGLVLLVIAITWGVIKLMEKGYRKLTVYIELKKESWLKELTYKDYTFLSAHQELKIINSVVTAVRWIMYISLIYIALPIIFSIFPFSRNWADMLFQLIWSPFKGVLLAVWKYMPNLFSIIVIYVVMMYVIRFVKYIFNEIDTEKLKINGFHADWAMPTYSIVKFLLYAFMFVLIFPYLPGSDSNIFKGVSVFVGVLFSLGSSSAIANIVAGLVITYMRPFKLGDRVKIGDVFGDVEEKNLLVTRVKTPKNEIITIPNSSVLSGNTINYSSEISNSGLILHTTVTIGYDVPWQDMHEALIEAASRTEHVLSEPLPFVLQTSLDDFYVSYQLNAYTKEVKKQALIYSFLHQHIQDVCNERGIEILSPHYRAARDGNATTIPANYLPKDYKAPSFNIKMQKTHDKQSETL